MAIFRFLASLFGMGGKPQAPAPDGPSDNQEAMRELRLRMLTTPPSALGIQPKESFSRVYGVLMDWHLDGQTVTVVSMYDGHASLYTTTGFGILGGIGHASVRAAAIDFVKLAQVHYEAASFTGEYPYPIGGHTRFYLICFDGVRVIDSETGRLAEENCPFSDLFVAGQRVITELRAVSQSGSASQE